MELFEGVRANHTTLEGSGEGIFNIISNKFPHLQFSEEEKLGLFSKGDNFMKTLKLYWKGSNRCYHSFVAKRKEWLSRRMTVHQEHRPSSGGRPTTTFNLASRTTRKRKTNEIVDHHSLEELLYATERKLRKRGSKDAANMLKELAASPHRASKIKKSFRKSLSDPPPQKFSPEEALSLIVSTQLTAFQYSLIRKSAVDRNIKLYPSYHAVLRAKKACYPPDISVDDSCAEIRLQSNVDYMIRRFFIAPNEEIISFLKESTVNELQYVVKWGCDGCGGLSRYKQIGNNADNSIVDDSSILASSFVPLQIRTITEGHDNQNILWQNPRTSSPRFCRPIRIRFVKETTDELAREISHIERQISLLVPTEVEVCGKTLKIIPKFLLTMVDGKVCNAMASNACTQRCYICGATPKIMNLLEKREVNEDSISWGLSPLHAHIRFMECILHISYRLEVPKWNVRLTDEEKDIIKEKKEKVIRDFRLQTGLLIDTPKQGGGNTNDGNTARRFFSDAMTSSFITGVDHTLIERFRVILKTLACGQQVNATAFEKYATETAKRYVSLYNWHPMPVSVHKILVHGAVIIERHLIPIGQLSEDVLESQHKHFKRLRVNNSRKMSRTATNTDILNNLLISTDPLITSLRHIPPPKDKTKLDKSVKALLQCDLEEILDSSDESDSDDLGVSGLEI